jgi:hypothetical protein
MEERPKRTQTGIDRDLQSESRRRRTEASRVQDAIEEVTSPFDLFDRDPDDRARAVVRQSTRNGNDPATVFDVAKLAVALSKERSENRQRGRDYEAVLRSPKEIADKIEARLDATEAKMRSAQKMVIAAVVTLAGGVGTIASGILNRAESHGGDVVRLQALEKAVDRIDSELHEIRIQLGRRLQLDTSYLHLDDKGLSQ